MAAPGIPQKKTLSFWASSLNLCGWHSQPKTAHPLNHWFKHPSWMGLAQVELRYEITMPALRWCTFCWVPLTGSCRYEIHVGSSGIASNFFAGQEAWLFPGGWSGEVKASWKNQPRKRRMSDIFFQKVRMMKWHFVKQSTPTKCPQRLKEGPAFARQLCYKVRELQKTTKRLNVQKEPRNSWL